MSDAAKSPEEIEDVLASIRRLVSDQPDPSHEASEPADAPKPAAVDTGERLVLTPSFRVQEAGDPWVPVDTAEESPAAAAEDDGTPDHAQWQPDDRLAEFDTVAGSSVAEGAAPLHEAEPDATDLHVEDLHDSDLEIAERAEDAPSSVADPEDPIATEDDLADLQALDGLMGTDDIEAAFESETGDDNWPADGAEAALLTLAARREDAAPQTRLEEVEDGTDPAPEATSPPVFSRRRPLSTPRPAAAPSDASLAPSIALASRSASDDTLSVAAPDAEPAGSDETTEEAALDAVETNSDVAETPTATQTGPEAEAEDLGADPHPFTFPDSDEEVDLLDEDTLRDLIVEVVREELQGVLGQRITRNVRKMVRREIRLALAAEELE